MAETPRKPGLKRYGYWDYPDPEQAIRRLLKRRPDLLKSFEEELQAEEDGDDGGLRFWADANADLPSEVRTVVTHAYEDGAFDEVEIGRGWGGGFDGRLTARRRGGLIHYRSRGEDPVEAPPPTRGPLPMKVLKSLLLPDPDGWADDLDDLDEDDPDRYEDATREVNAWSDFYDLQGALEAMASSTVKRVMDAREAPAEGQDDAGATKPASRASRGKRPKRS